MFDHNTIPGARVARVFRPEAAPRLPRQRTRETEIVWCDQRGDYHVERASNEADRDRLVASIRREAGVISNLRPISKAR